MKHIVSILSSSISYYRIDINKPLALDNILGVKLYSVRCSSKDIQDLKYCEKIVKNDWDFGIITDDWERAEFTYCGPCSFNEPLIITFKYIVMGVRQNYAKEILRHEFSRFCCYWDLIKYKRINLNPEIEVFLEKYQNLYLAGGALVSILLDSKVNDYDMFYVGDTYEFTNLLDNIRNEHDTIETLNSVSFNISGNKIQIIKRVYGEINHIVGGFDIDACRLIYLNGFAYGTRNGIKSIKENVIVVNEYCDSETFIRRLKKYKGKGFDIIFHKKKMPGIVDFSSLGIKKIRFGRSYGSNYLTYNKKLPQEYKDLRINLDAIIRGREDLMYLRGNRVFSLNEFIYSGKNKTDREFIERSIRNNYCIYAGVCRVLISNPSSQITGSFYPAQNKYFSKCKNRFMISMFDLFPELLISMIVLKKMPKFIKYMILSYCF